MNEALFERLKSNIKGEVRTDPFSRKVYSVDASIYEVEPLCIVLPNCLEDIIFAVQLAKEFQCSIIPRGAATGITGGCLGAGIVIDTSKFMNRILKIDTEKKTVVCEPGVIQDQLNDALKIFGYRLGPDTSTGNRATLGGMLANNSAGSRSLKFGKMVDAAIAVDLILANGEIIHLNELTQESFDAKCRLTNAEGEIYRAIHKIRQESKQEIQNHFPNIPRRVSGYNLNEIIYPESVNLCRLIAGSEGTLGIAAQITLNIVPILKDTGICLVHFHDMIEGMRAVKELLSFNPIAIEMIDNKIIEMAKQSPTVKGKLDWLEGNPEAVFAIEIDTPKLNTLIEYLQAQKIGYSPLLLTDPEKISHVWEVRKAGLGLLMSKRSYSRAIAFVEDISVPPENLADFMEWFKSYLQSHGKEAGIYGHVGSGCMHIRPYIDMRNQDELKLMETILIDTTKMLMKHGGALSGEHGDGLVRSWLNRELFGEKIYQLFLEIKRAFDPENLMNPGKIVNGEPFLKNLRTSKEIHIHDYPTFLDFSKEGGIAFAADMCNGNALCRKPTETMCPSFQATQDEFHSTRARAQMLRSIFTGRLPLDELAGDGLKNVLDLCIECKGCKTECPSQVDMAKMKSEVLYQYQKKHGIKLRDRLFGFIGKSNHFFSLFPSLFNWLSKTALSKHTLNIIGISPERELPQLAIERFSRSFKKRDNKIKSSKKVVLFNDTFTEFNCPNIGMAATRVLEALGYEVILPPWQCCGRPLISKGLLEQAREYAKKLLKTLEVYAKLDIPIVGLEPSCLLTIKDDYQGLLRKDIAKLNLFTFDEFIANQMINGVLPLSLDSTPKVIKVHGHCHQKALIGMQPTMHVLKSIPNVKVSEIPSGCCGMAGSFGYEKEHYAISLKIGDLKLFPAIQETDKSVIILASGFSCRHQILHGTDRPALHLAEVLDASLIKKSPPRIKV